MEFPNGCAHSFKVRIDVMVESVLNTCTVHTHDHDKHSIDSILFSFSCGSTIGLSHIYLHLVFPNAFRSTSHSAHMLITKEQEERTRLGCSSGSLDATYTYVRIHMFLYNVTTAAKARLYSA